LENKGTAVNTPSPGEVASVVARFPSTPIGWSLLCAERDLRKGPAVCQVLGERLVAFRTAMGRIGVLDSRCGHFGADLAKGRVVGEALECPYHSWSYHPDGSCARLPAQPEAACDVRQLSYPAEVRQGLVYVFHGPRALYPLPFFDGEDPDKFVSSKPLDFVLECPWYMVGANSFDFQHLYSVHERRMLEPPQADCPTPWSRVATTRSAVGTSTWYDRLTHWFSGPEAEMTATDWGGSLIFVRVRLDRTTTYGMVSLRPLASNKTLVRIVAHLPRTRSHLLDAARVRLRLLFIHWFLRSDATRLDGLRAGPMHLIEADREFFAYLQWLARVSNGLPADSVGPLQTHPKAIAVGGTKYETNV
jgi:phenylpropionate dioxygenase-like ring-hydroxylating dioxygenase large terminal subunit